MTASPHAAARPQDGYTFVELLVVILVIGSLAAIALPAFLSHARGAGGCRDDGSW